MIERDFERWRIRYEFGCLVCHDAVDFSCRTHIWLTDHLEVPTAELQSCLLLFLAQVVWVSSGWHLVFKVVGVKVLTTHQPLAHQLIFINLNHIYTVINCQIIWRWPGGRHDFWSVGAGYAVGFELVGVGRVASGPGWGGRGVTGTLSRGGLDESSAGVWQREWVEVACGVGVETVDVAGLLLLIVMRAHILLDLLNLQSVPYLPLTIDFDIRLALKHHIFIVKIKIIPVFRWTFETRPNL